MPRRKKPVFVDTGDRIIMDISVAEARTLMVLLDRCGGDPNTSPRKFIDSLGSALQAAGVQPPSQEINDWCTGDLSFRAGNIEKNWPKNPDYKGFEMREKRGQVIEIKHHQIPHPPKPTTDWGDDLIESKYRK